MAGPVQAPAGFTIIAREAVASTQDDLRALAADGAGDGTVVWARRQLAGRGRRERHWDSPEGNLYASLLVRPETDLAAAAQLSFVAALALWQGLAEHVEPSGRLGLKWPNDLLLDGAKVAGILLEAEPAAPDGRPWVLIGTGVNLVSHPPGTAFPATDLAARGLRHLTPERLLGDYLAAFAHWRGLWRSQGFGPVREAWLNRAVGLDGPVTVRLPGRNLQGRFVALDDTGALLLETDAGARHIVTAGDVFFG